MRKILICFVLAFGMSCFAKNIVDIPAPLYADSHYCGSCDPEIIWNPELKEWMIFYTGRRPALGQASACGTPIGVCTSKDMKHWKFQGYCTFDGEGGKPDSEHTFWAPGCIVKDGLIHISKLSKRRVEKVTDVVNIGDTVTVEIIEIDEKKGRINLRRIED